MAKYSKTIFMAPFWWIAGCEVDLLKQDDCRTDRQKYAAIGAVILMTSLIALVAGFSAAWWFTQTTANPHGDKLLSFFFGVFWAAFIFCVDRSLVITLRKCKGDKWYKFIGPFILRAILAVFIAGMISIPLELMVFKGSIGRWQKEINRDELKIAENDAKEIYERVSEKDIDRFEEVKDDAQKELNILKKQKVALQKSLDSLRNTSVSNYDPYIQANNNVNYYTRLLNESGVKKEDKRKYEENKVSSEKARREAETAFNLDKSKKITNIQATISNVDGLIKEAEIKYATSKSNYENNLSIKAGQNQNINKEIDDVKNEQQSANLFLEYYKALSWGVEKDENQKERNLLWMIRIMFWLFEIMPTMVKLMTGAGAYDRKLQKLEAHNISYFESEDFKNYIINLRNHDKSLQEKIIEERDKYRIELEQSISDKLRVSGLELAEKIIAKWKIEEENNL
jgi:hypothetical protein